ncbi:hypothetical protein LRS13_13485 [Svornostia abyssi]|uniref:HPt domain-containing protein n=1 Tax=Svornostia abyssi TaxID=2898438 RepID=A0ABY5PB63_9ACTN|nr:hypothetical protein LRS13_13485 [Parviterribacteraceae bacterium J379]
METMGRAELDGARCLDSATASLRRAAHLLKGPAVGLAGPADVIALAQREREQGCAAAALLGIVQTEQKTPAGDPLLGEAASGAGTEPRQARISLADIPGDGVDQELAGSARTCAGSKRR